MKKKPLTLNKLITAALADYPRHGLTSHQCAIVLGKPFRSVVPTLFYMEQAGEVEIIGTRESVITGSRLLPVYRLTKEG